jgi:hypothetical protein
MRIVGVEPRSDPWAQRAAGDGARRLPSILLSTTLRNLPSCLPWWLSCR